MKHLERVKLWWLLLIDFVEEEEKLVKSRKYEKVFTVYAHTECCSTREQARGRVGRKREKKKTFQKGLVSRITSQGLGNFSL